MSTIRQTEGNHRATYSEVAQEGLPRPPLAGIRILDFTWAGVGPYCTFLCSIMGAECIKVETSARVGYFDRRASSGQRTALPDAQLETRMRVVNWDLNELNVNKLSVTLNVKKPEGLRIARRLAALSDAVVDNFRAGVMVRLGLGPEELLRLNPSLVVLSASTHGQGGPEAYGAGFAQIFGALAGAAYLTGYEDGPPVELRLPSDLISGTLAAYALLTAIYHARRTGQGQFVDFAAREGFASFTGERLLDAAINHRDEGRCGNRDEVMAPHDVYRCAGEDAWVAIAVATDQEWRALCQATGHPEWLVDPRFADRYRRWHYQEKLNRLLSQWAINYTPTEAMERLQGAGVAATPSSSAVDILGDPHFTQREIIRVTESLEGQAWVMMGEPWHLARTPGAVQRPPPEMGQDTRYVAEDLLGLTGAEMEQLQSSGALQ